MTLFLKKEMDTPARLRSIPVMTTNTNQTLDKNQLTQLARFLTYKPDQYDVGGRIYPTDGPFEVKEACGKGEIAIIQTLGRTPLPGSPTERTIDLDTLVDGHGRPIRWTTALR